MSDAASVSRDPNFRSQYDGPVQLDPEFEAALSGQSAPIQMRQVSRPLGETPLQMPPMVRLR